MSARLAQRRVVPLPSVLSSAFARYVAAHVERGTVGAEAWRLARKRDGSLWLAIDVVGRRGIERVELIRFAGDITEALYAMTRDIDALAP